VISKKNARREQRKLLVKFFIEENTVSHTFLAAKSKHELE
jgi:hypothetical protein